MPSSTEIDDIVEEIINNLRPLRCTLSTATRDIAKIIERGPSQTLSIQQGCVEDALELIITLSHREPSSAPDKNLRTITSLLFNLYGRIPIGLERACAQAMKHWREKRRTYSAASLL
jgi:hypothetical protein